MDLMKILQATGQQDKIVAALGQQFGLDGDKAGNVVSQVMSKLGQGVEQNVQSEGGLGALVGLLGQGNAESIAEAPEQISNQAEAVTQEGNNLLGQLMGSKDASREAAAQIANDAGVDEATVKGMLPMIATMAMGALSKKAGGAQGLEQAVQGGNLGGLMSLLDQDNDGSIVDDALGMLGGLMGKK